VTDSTGKPKKMLYAIDMFTSQIQRCSALSDPRLIPNPIYFSFQRLITVSFFLQESFSFLYIIFQLI
jgi:hypothetical protein